MDFTEDELHAFLGTVPEQRRGPAEPQQPQGDPEPEDTPQQEPETALEDQAESNRLEDVIPSDGETAVPAPTGGERPPDYEAEKQAAVQQAVAEAVAREQERAQDEWKAFFARAGLKNSVTGADITSRAEFEAWYKVYEAARMKKDLEEGKLTPEMLQKVADRAVEERIRRQVQPPEQPAPPPRQEVSQEQIKQELAVIHQMDGSVSTLEDIARMPTWGVFREAVMHRGCSFVEAFRLANFDAIMERQRADAARRAAQAAVNNARSKDHLAASASRGSGAVSVPGDEMELYRRLNPGKSAADIQDHYNKMLRDARRTALSRQ